MAAEHLAISQPAVSQSIKMLESAVGTRLFIRTSRGVRLTAEGELLAGYVSAGYEQIEHDAAFLSIALSGAVP